MEIKLFGKNLFEAKSSKSEYFIGLANTQQKESKFLPDFYVTESPSSIFDDFTVTQSINGGAVVVPVKKGAKKVEVKPVAKIELTPKGVHQLKMLNDDGFKVNTDSKYVDEQIATFKDKLNLISKEEFDMRRGVTEIASILTRMENRKRYADFKEFFDQYPYTTTSKINGVIKAHDYLKCGQVAQFLADMPKEAVDAMKEYNKNVHEMCGKQGVFYIIANKKDFQKSDKRRDPILLAQSPYGHFWQILGAWDEEMLFLEQL